MIIKSKGLISYFGTRIVTKKTIMKHYYHLTVSYNAGPIDLGEVTALINAFPDLISISVISDDSEVIRNTLLAFPENKISRVFICPTGNFELKVEDLEKFPEVKILKIVGKSRSSLKKLEVPKSVKNLFISNFDEIDDIDLSNNPNNPTIKLNEVRKKLFYSLDPKIAELIQEIGFDVDDRTVDTIAIGDIFKKFPNLSLIEDPPYLDKNVSDLSDVTEFLKRCEVVDMSADLIERYKKYYDENNIAGEFKVYLGKTQAITESYIKRLDGLDDSCVHYPASQIKSSEDCLEYVEISKEKEIVFCAQNMADLPLEIVNELKRLGINCKIRFNSHDNTDNQNSVYTLDEYIAIFRKINELIDDIDIDLPEQERFGKIYRRIVDNIEYDYISAYPITAIERKYAEANSIDSRNLTNGLLHGKCVCSGYADILKNACLLKGLECEFVAGPVDTIRSKVDHDLDLTSDDGEEIIQIYDSDVVAREYHAWNKVKINGAWYNCDPTNDKIYLSKGKIPKYALLSDDLMVKMGRPTSRIERCPCDRTATASEKREIFPGLEPSGQIVTKQRLIDFEKTLDEYGNPKQLPIVRKRTFWELLLRRLKIYARYVKDTFSDAISSFREKSDNKTYDDNDDVILDGENIINDYNSKRESWQLTDEQLKNVQNKSKNKLEPKTDSKKITEVDEKDID